jgi:hypothetical protein
MRIWSLHPRYLDRQGLVACWRETLLAQAVLAGRTRGYLKHPQLQRFRAAPDSLEALGFYLAAVADEADARGYRFDRTRIDRSDVDAAQTLAVSNGQLEWEWMHLVAKLRVRSPDVLGRWSSIVAPQPHPLFRTVDGPIESWERLDPPN